jgi:hypothetical protein
MLFSPDFYYLKFSALSKSLYLTVRYGSVRLWLFTLLLLFLYFLHLPLHIFFRLLDEILFPAYRKLKLTEPVFIIANPRSGTTYLHRLMSLDENHFTSMKLINTIFPSVSFYKLIRMVAWIDSKTGNIIRKIMNRIDKKLYGGWDDIHKMGFDKAEEDEAIFAMTLTSPGLAILFPFLHLQRELKFLDKREPEVREKVMAFYANCQQRFVFASGRNKKLLVKNVFSTGRFKSLMKQFPDARIIFLARHPYDAVPSMASMFSTMYGVHSPRLKKDAPPYKEWAELSIDFYAYFYEMKRHIPQNRFIAIKYDDLVENPTNTIEHIFNHFGWKISPQYRQALNAEKVRSKNYVSKHNYSLEQFSISTPHINQRIGEVMDDFGFEKSN